MKTVFPNHPIFSCKPVPKFCLHSHSKPFSWGLLVQTDRQSTGAPRATTPAGERQRGPPESSVGSSVIPTHQGCRFISRQGTNKKPPRNASISGRANRRFSHSPPPPLSLKIKLGEKKKREKGRGGRKGRGVKYRGSKEEGRREDKGKRKEGKGKEKGKVKGEKKEKAHF